MRCIEKICHDFATHLSVDNLAPTTISDYTTCVKQLLNFSRDILSWNETEKLEPYHFHGYYLFLFTEQEKLSTVKYKLSVLRKWQDSLSRKLPDFSLFFGPIPTFKEMQSLYLHPAEHELGYRNKLLLLLAMCYGLTTTELNRLDLKNVDLGQRKLVLKTNCILEQRSLPLIPIAIDCYQRYLATRRPTKYLLVNKKGLPLSEAGLRHILREMLKQVALPNYCFMDLRRGWLKHISSQTSIPTLLFISGLGPELEPDDYNGLLEKWHDRLTNGDSFLGEMDR